jgi:hypothetical protein
VPARATVASIFSVTSRRSREVSNAETSIAISNRADRGEQRHQGSAHVVFLLSSRSPTAFAVLFEFRRIYE